MIQAKETNELKYKRDLFLFRMFISEAQEVLMEDFRLSKSSKILNDYRVCANAIKRQYSEGMIR